MADSKRRAEIDLELGVDDGRDWDAFLDRQLDELEFEGLKAKAPFNVQRIRVPKAAVGVERG